MTKTSDTEILRRLDAVDDWPGLVQKMIAYAVQLAKIEYKWRAGTVLPKGYDIKDVVYTTIKKLYSEERTWNPDKVSLEAWLRLNIRSEMNNLFRSAYTHSGEVREVPLPPDNKRGSVPIEKKAVVGEMFERHSPNPEAIVVEKEKGEYRNVMIEALYEAIEGDEVAEEIYYAVLDGCERKPRVLASRLGRPKDEINNALRRIDRRAERIAAEMNSDNV